jgi:hypothetical protein
MGHNLKLKYALSQVECAYFSLKSVPFGPTTVQMPNLALIETKQITVQCGVGTKVSIPLYRFGIFNQSMGARKGVGRGPARLHSLSELIPWNRFLGS